MQDRGNFFNMEYSRILLIRVIIITKSIKKKRGGEQLEERKLCRNTEQDAELRIKGKILDEHRGWAFHEEKQER